jgi:membrane protease subunit HflK
VRAGTGNAGACHNAAPAREGWWIDMPWKQQGGGGGPWGGGGGGQGPWGRGGGGGGFGGGQPPDLEELLRKGQDRLRKVMPGGWGTGRGLVLVGIAAVLLWLASGFYRVQPDEQGVVLTFGEWTRTTAPGLNYRLPSPIESVLTPKVTRVNRIEIGHRSGAERRRGSPVGDVPEESGMLTGDENIVDIDSTVFWRIKDAGQFLFNLRDPEGTVKVAAESTLRAIIGQTPIQSALTEGRTQIENISKDRLQKLLDDYGAGILIDRVQLLKVDPPQPVIDAFIDVQRARADLERARNEAEAYRNDILPRARGDAERIVQEARAYREQIVNKAQGEAKRFLEIFASYRVAKDVTIQRMYIETFEEVFRGMPKVIIDSSKGSSGVVPYLPLPELQRRQAQPPAPQGASQ